MVDEYYPKPSGPPVPPKTPQFSMPPPPVGPPARNSNPKRKIKIFLAAAFLLLLMGVGAAWAGYKYIEKSLPQLMSVADYQPLLVSQVYDRNGKQIGEFFRERRVLVPFDKIPKQLVNSFLAAEDDQFYKHGGLNYLAILRASLANLRAGKNVQGASTITQQVAKTLFLTSEKKLVRKIKEAILAQKMEENLKKDEILYLYLNQIYFGQGAYGVALAAETYFRKPLDKLTLGEMAILAGLPKAPSEYSPTHNSVRAKERQVYVLNRMAEVGFITKEEAQKAAVEPVHVYLRENYKDSAPFFLETVRQILVSKLGEEAVLDQGLKIYTSLDLGRQLSAQESMVTGLKELDKRQGYRGASGNTVDPKEVGAFLLRTRNKLILDEKPERIIQPDGKFAEYGTLNVAYDIKNGLPFYIKPGKTTEGIVSKVDDELGVVFVKFAELEGLIDIETMQWARKPNVEKRFDLDKIQKPSQALKMGDLIQVKLVGERFGSTRLQNLLKKTKKTIDLSKYVGLELDQDPVSEAALLSIDQDTQDILAMIGGTNFEKSEYNRALQAARQTGSCFKSIVYASALDHGFTPSSLLMDAPIVYGEQKSEEDQEGQGANSGEEAKIWKPANHSKSFAGDITFRNALVKSLNIPAVKVIEDLGVPWAAEYAKRLGIFSPLNMDFTLALGSSSVTLYEMTRVFSEFGRLGKRTHPLIIKKVTDANGKKLLDQVTLDERFEKETAEQDQEFEERRKEYLSAKKTETAATAIAEANVPAKDKKPKTDEFLFFNDAEQLIKPTTAYLITSLLKGVVEDPQGTGARAKALGREVAGKTGTTNGYYDAWFLGYTPQIATGVWVGFDQQRTLGKGEVGGRAALPIWLDYMKAAHEDLPPLTFPVPAGIVFANIDADSGQLPGPATKRIVRQAYLEGTEPTFTSKSKKEEDTDFYKQDLSD